MKMAASSSSFFLHLLPCTKVRGRKQVLFHAKAEKAAALLVTEKQKKIKILAPHEKIASGVASLLASFRRSRIEFLKPLDAEIILERGIINCRFFTLLAIAGTLVGSILCFVEGCFLMVESYIGSFHIMSHRLDNGKLVQLVIESIDVFLIGTAMLTFGMRLYSMFIGFSRTTTSGWLIHGSKSFGLSNLKMLSGCPRMNSISYAKSRLGQAVVMLLQVGAMEKFKNVPLVTGLDLACFAGALMFSSASMFLLSRLHFGSKGATDVQNSQST